MLWEEIKNIKSTDKDLRSFGFVIGTALLLIAGYLFWKKEMSFIYFAVAGGLVVFVALLLPGILKPFQKVWMTIAVLMGFVMTKLILSVLFFVILTPLSLLSWIVGKKFLDLKMDVDAVSYWNKREEIIREGNYYEQQF